MEKQIDTICIVNVLHALSLRTISLQLGEKCCKQETPLTTSGGVRPPFSTIAPELLTIHSVCRRSVGYCSPPLPSPNSMRPFANLFLNLGAGSYMYGR